MDTKRFIELLNEIEIEPRSYSGRGMYGKKCVGIEVGRGEDLVLLGVRLSDQCYNKSEVNMLEQLLDGGSFESDSMGKDNIYYWERIAWPVDLKEADDEGE